jgi:hypothetical protein
MRNTIIKGIIVKFFLANMCVGVALGQQHYKPLGQYVPFHVVSVAIAPSMAQPDAREIVPVHLPTHDIKLAQHPAVVPVSLAAKKIAK